MKPAKRPVRLSPGPPANSLTVQQLRDSERAAIGLKVEDVRAAVARCSALLDDVDPKVQLAASRLLCELWGAFPSRSSQADAPPQAPPVINLAVFAQPEPPPRRTQRDVVEGQVLTGTD